MKTAKSGAVLTVLTTSLAIAAPAFGFGPNADTSENTADRAVIACAGVGAMYDDGVIARQTEREVEAGGGPKSGVVAPSNCDHFWQTPESEDGAGAIGNGHWPPPGSLK